jgi:AraC-like DNA-binding protein
LEPTLIFNTGAPISIVDASGNLLNVATGQAFFAGLHQRFCFSRCGGSQSGVHVRLSPQAAWRLLGPGTAACADHAVLVADVAGRGLATALRRQGPPQPSRARADVIELLDRAMIEAPELCPETDWSIGELARPGITVAAVAAELGWSRRRLIARCRQVLGLTPKVFGRIARYQRLLATLDAEDTWADRAIAFGYFDQSHMIRDFLAFTGRSPHAYVGDRVTFVQ